MKQFFGATLLCGALLLSPVATHAQSTASQPDLYQATLLQLIDALLMQIAELEAELLRRQELANEQEVSAPRQIVERDFLSGTARVKAQYLVDGEDSYQDIPYWNQRRYLREVLEIVPDVYDSRIGEFVVFDDGEGNFDAFVQTIPPDHELWTFGVHEDVLDDVGTDANAELIVHEFAHIFSYDDVPGVRELRGGSCHDYFTNGCPDRNSYLMQFIDDFWSRGDLSRVERYRSARDPLDVALDYYDTIEDEDWFITDYASVAPEEDFAESFAFYIMNRPIGDDTLAEQKVWWFDQYPEMQELRNEIRRSF